MIDDDVIDNDSRGHRDARGEWQPSDLPRPSPPFVWPPKPWQILKYIFGWNGLFLPWNALYIGVGAVVWHFLTPDIKNTVSLRFGWIALIYLRNVALMTVLYGSLHLRLYIRRRQGTNLKYTDKWPATGNRKFFFGNQNLENVFLSLVSGAFIWSLYEAVTLWAFANELIPFVDWRERPLYCVLLLFAIPLLRDIHFYFTHRVFHWKPLYKSAHYLHHKNVNIGPWSGMSMHPLEHLVYLSGVFLHWIIPSHPVHAIAHLIHAGLSPAKGHAGFYKIELTRRKGKTPAAELKTGGYFHYLHHRFFTVNFGTEIVPLDDWFGSFHDGTQEAHQAMLERRKQKRNTT